MSEEETRIPEAEPPDKPPVVPYPPPWKAPEGNSGCLGMFLKGLAILVIGIFVLAGLVFATCFLSVRR